MFQPKGVELNYIEDSTDTLEKQDDDTFTSVTKEKSKSNENNLLKQTVGGSNPKVKLNPKHHSVVEDVDANEDSKNIEDMKVDLDLFIEMINHCTKKSVETDRNYKYIL